MTNIKFEGDIDGMNERQLEFVSTVLKDRGFINEIVQVLAVGKAGENNVAGVKRFVVEKNESTFKMIAKVAPTIDILSDQMQTGLMFENEHVMYTEVLPKCMILEEEANIPENKRLRYAECYGSQSEASNEIILLEDLQLSSFVMLDKFISLTVECVKLALKNFAILHSLSYKLKHQEPETYKTFKDRLVNNWALMEELEGSREYFQQLEEDIVAILDTDEYKNLVKGSLIMLPQIAKSHDIYKESEYDVITQGDPWTNNILYKLEGHEILECCMIDYQLSGHNSPVADLHYMIFNCTDYETRSKHYHEWIHYYHDQLDKCLTRFGLDVKLVYPREKLDADLTRLAKMYFGYSIMLTSMLMKEERDDAAQHVSDAGDSEFNVQRFKTKVVGLITSFQELGYL